MTANPVLRAFLLSATTLLIGACASQSASSRESLDDKYFQAEAKHYDKLDYHGMPVYCTNEHSDGLVPYEGRPRCLTEGALRQRVENARRARNTVVQTRVPPG
jgi:hypothetical protein